MSLCGYCGRKNDASARYCMDCGKPLTKAAELERAARSVSAGGAGVPTQMSASRGGGAQVPEEPPAADARDSAALCPFCGAARLMSLPFCAQCGQRLTAPGSGAACPRCQSALGAGAKFCATCGADASGPAMPPTSRERRLEQRFALILVDEAGRPLQRFERAGVDTTLGRADGDLRFPDDVLLSPLHARLSWEAQRLVVRDLGSRNQTWVFLTAPHRLVDGDLLLIGSQIIRFRRLGYPGPHPPEVDATSRMGSAAPSADIASLTQLRADGSARDVVHLSPGRDVHIGRERGDWVFPYDPSMSARHALVRSDDADFVVLDQNSRNGVALAVRGEVALEHGARLLVGDKLLRVEFPA